jgi:hypothetical protein
LEQEMQNMSDLIERTFNRLAGQLRGRLSRPRDEGYAAATAIWAKPVGRMPRAIAHCRTSEDVQFAIRAARECDLPLSVRGGGHDWAGRALCAGLVIDLSGMNDVAVRANNRFVRMSGGARASDVLAVTDPLGLAVATGSCGAVGMAGLTLGGGYGSLIGRFGLALDNLAAAEVVLADGSVVIANEDEHDELFWALRGGGGNFGVVTTMHHQLHRLASVRSGMLICPFSEAKAVLTRCADIAASMPDELTVQLGLVAGPDGAPVVLVVPTWSGRPEEGEARLARFFQVGTLLANSVGAMPYGASVAAFDAYIVNGRRTFMETCWLPSLGNRSIDALVQAMQTAVSLGCAIIIHEFKGAASRVPAEATAFGLRRDHVLVEIIASFDDGVDPHDERRHFGWARSTRHAFEPTALPGGYPNLLAGADADRVAKSFGGSAGRLIKAKRSYDPDDVFRSAIPLPTSRTAPESAHRT